MKYRIFAAVIAVLLTFSASVSVFAREPYAGYTYDTYGDRVPAPNVFLPQKEITGYSLGIGHMSKPSDVFVDEEDNVYLMDTGNGRVIILDNKYNLKKVVDNFTLDGNPSPLKDASGIFANAGRGLIYIADKGNGRVIVTDFDGNILRSEGKPETDYLSDDIMFAPRKIVVNSIGTMYVLSDNINQGMIAIDEDGVFQGFFGAEKIQLTPVQRADLMWRKVLTKAQQSYAATIQPTEYTNIFIDNEDFIYTATALETYEKAQIKRLNPSEKNILYEDMRYGDLEGELVNGVYTVSALIDVTVDDDGFIYALDKNFGRVYMYDEESWNLGIFGKKDTVWGTFGEPIAIDNAGGNILVLDNAKASLFVFEPTEYGKYIIEAENYHYKGRYALALEPWEMVRDMNNNYEWAYAGIGRAQHMVEEYKPAMDNFRLANNRYLYSQSKKKYRTYILRKNFTAYTILFLVICIGGYIIVKKRRKIAEFIKRKINNGISDKGRFGQ
ncbi:MAG: hypothetical protein J1F64_07825 [Oscillospiraceae bacterium]|nr:hypothetical protein [Oscillospiraceae bacterium]